MASRTYTNWNDWHGFAIQPNVGELPMAHVDWSGPDPAVWHDQTHALDGFAPRGPMETPLTGVTLARAQFLTWLKKSNRALFRDALAHAESTTPAPGGMGRYYTGGNLFGAYVQPMGAYINGMGAYSTGMGATDGNSWWQNLSQGILSAGTAYLTYKGQKELLSTNIQRANRGLPPIDSRYAQPGVNLDLSPEVMARLKSTGLTMTGILAIGGAAVALILLMNRGGSRRR